MRTIGDRLRARVDRAGPIPEYRPDLGSCWLWLGRPGNHGYGRMRIEGVDTLAHRVAYELFIGPIPNAMTIDHLCRVSMCVRPSHLEAVTRGENVMRGIGFAPANAAKTHCPQGHAYDETNTYRNPRTGHRLCRACNRQRARAT